MNAQPARNWDGVAAIIAALVGLLALCVSAYTAHVQRQQAKAQVWTQLIFANSDTDRTLMVMNKGVGPARLQSLRVYADGKAQPDWDHVFDALGIKSETASTVQSTLNGIVVAANERVDFLKFNNADEWSRFRAQGKRVQLRACYCSVLDECVVFDERVARAVRGAVSSRTTAVDRCERDDAEEFNQ